MDIRNKIQVMEAFERGDEIEHRYRLNDMWFKSRFPSWNWREFEYRIKPKPKQVIVLETWLVYDILSNSYAVAEESNIEGYIKDDRGYLSKIKLLSTRKVEL